MSIDKYRLFLDTAQVGWWQADFENGYYICSDYLVSLMQLHSDKISFSDFIALIREDYQERIKKEFLFFKGIGIYEQIFPLLTCYGYKFVRSKICEREIDDTGKINVLGIMQLLPYSDSEADKLKVKDQLNGLLRHLGSLTRSLHSFIQTNDLPTSIHLVLTEILNSIDTKGRASIMEYMNDGQTLNCTYEVCSEGVSPVRSSLQNIPVSTLPWSTRKIKNLYPVLINNLDELPPEAAEEKRYLRLRGTLSMILVPLIIKGKAWGYMGIDIIVKNRIWNLEDYQWLSSIANIISIITKMARINEALDCNERVLRNIYNNIPAGIELYDKDGYLVDLNNMDIEIFGIESKASVLGLNIFENPIIPEEVRKKLLERKPATFRVNYSFDVVNKYYKTDREGNIDVFTKVSMLYDTHGDLINYLFINLDNTDKTVAYNRIEEFEHFFRLVSSFAKVGYAKFDLLTNDGYAISQWYQNLGEKDGTPLPDIIGVYKAVHPEDRQVMLNFFKRVKQGKANSIRKELRIRAGEDWKWVRVNVMRNTQSVDPKKLEMICVNYDITELKEIQKQREKAEELDRLKSAFLANMSHEIRTPLNAIVGFSTLLVDTDDPEEKLQFVDIIQKNNDLLLQLISDVLDLAKIESNALELNFSSFDLLESCEELVTSMRIKLPENVTLNLAPGLSSCVITCDRIRLTQILSNFINNAIKHTAKGSITLDYQLRPREIEYSVTDTGEGMSPEISARVFDRFYKGNSFKQGTGLGLSICKSIVEQFGGKIGVKSVPGKGSRFWFTLPR